MADTYHGPLMDVEFPPELTWVPADHPPEHAPELWSREVLVRTNLNRIFWLAYSGIWQRPHGTAPGEVVVEWADVDQGQVFASNAAWIPPAKRATKRTGDQ